jgi:glycosyltransferase involved in cell wall biosynthesis
MLAELEWRKLRSYEGEACGLFDHVLVVSDDDRNALAQTGASAEAMSVVPIAVDTDALVFSPRTAASTSVLSVATMFYPPNVEGVLWFARDVFPIVRARVPETAFSIVGSRPPSEIRKLAGPARGIEVPGYVSNLTPLVEGARVLVVPVRAGSGMRVKILEAFARGVPVVSTTVGAEGIDAVAGEHLLIADDPNAFADAVVSVLNDLDYANALASAGRTLAERRYDWRTALSGLDRIYPPSLQEGGQATAGVEVTRSSAGSERQ